MLFEDITYLHNKHNLTREQQEEMESKMDVYFNVISKQVKNWDTMETGWEHSTTLTRKQIGNYIGIDIILEIRNSYPIGFNYDINGNKM
jgi:hypothetical protein